MLEDGGWDEVVLCTDSLSALVALVGGRETELEQI